MALSKRQENFQVLVQDQLLAMEYQHQKAADDASKVAVLNGPLNSSTAERVRKLQS